MTPNKPQGDFTGANDPTQTQLLVQDATKDSCEEANSDGYSASYSDDDGNAVCAVGRS